MTEERPYPVQRRWLLKPVLSSFLMAVIVAVFFTVSFFAQLSQGSGGSGAAFAFILFLGIILLLMTVIALLNVIYYALRRSYFSYAFDEKFLTAKQGILRKQEMHLPYGVIQEVNVQRSVFDRILGLSSLSVLNAAQSGSSVDEYGNTTMLWRGIRVGGKRRSKIEMIGFRGNRLHIPGLLPQDAEALKATLLRKMKEHEGRDTGAGL